MKISPYIYLALVIILLGAAACADDEEIQPEGLSPFINAKFINNDSLAKINVAIQGISSQISSIDARISEIDASPNKGDLLDEKDSLNDVKDSISSERTELQQIRTLINNGSILLSVLTGPGAIGQIINDDTLRNYTFPLDANATKTTLFTIIDGEEGQIEFSYTITEEFVENQLRITASGIEVSGQSYDSAIIQCLNSKCISNDATVTIYF